MEDNSVEIKNITNSAILDGGTWINIYDEYFEYDLVKPEELYQGE